MTRKLNGMSSILFRVGYKGECKMLMDNEELNFNYINSCNHHERCHGNIIHKGL